MQGRIEGSASAVAKMHRPGPVNNTGFNTKALRKTGINVGMAASICWPQKFQRQLLRRFVHQTVRRLQVGCLQTRLFRLPGCGCRPGW